MNFEHSKEELNERVKFLEAKVGELEKQLETKKQAEEDQAKLSAFINNSPDFIGIADLNGNALFVNEAGQKLVGLKGMDEVRKTKIIDYFTPKYQELIQKEGIPAILKKGKWDVEVEFKNFKTGEVKPLYWNAFMISDPITGLPKFIGCTSPDLTKQKKSEEALKESEASFSSIFNQTSVGIAQTDLTGKFLLVNHRYSEIVGWTREELYQKQLRDITFPDDLKENIALLERSDSKGIPFDLEKRYIRPDGSLVWVSINVTTIRDSYGKPKYFLGVCQDITERKEQITETIQLKERLELMAKATRDAVWDWDLRTNQIWWNDGFKELFGYKDEEIEPGIESWYNRIHPEDQKRVEEGIHTVIDHGGKQWLDEYRFRRSDGTYAFVLDRGYCLHDEAGRPYRMAGSMQDISEWKLAQEALKESEARFRTMAEGADILIGTGDETTHATYLNKAWTELTGRSMEDLLNYGWADLLHDEDQQPTIDNYLNAFQKRQPFRREFRILSKSGEYRWLLGIATPRFRPDGSFAGYISSCIDITERKQAEKDLVLKNEQLVKINNDLDNFIYTASHDLKAPMSNIEGLLIALRNSLESEKDRMNEETDILLQLMDKSINRFKTTILDLTEISKVQKVQEEDINEINLTQAIEDIKLSIYDKIVQSRASIETDFSLVNSIIFSKKNLKSILYNLISNAIKYKDKNRTPEIFIKTERIDDYTVLIIKDNGLGINTQNLDKIFSMFKRFHDHVEGTGIGLYIVKRIIDNAGGKIEVESEVGKGTTFKVYFRN